MNWFQRATKRSQASAAPILMSALRGNMNEQQAIDALKATNDPETCSLISALMQNSETGSGVISAFPDTDKATAILQGIAAGVQCIQQPVQDMINQENDQAQDMPATGDIPDLM